MNTSMKLVAAGAMSLMMSQANAASGDIDLTNLVGGSLGVDQAAVESLVNNMFNSLVDDLSSAMSYKSVAPAEPLGLTGFDIGITVSGTQMANAQDWDMLVNSGNAMSTLPLAKVYLQKGLPFGIDIGAFYIGASSTNTKLVGAELKYAFLKGGAVTPAVAARLSYSKLSGINDFDFSTQGLDVSISKGLALFTPYAGVGIVKTTGEYTKALTLTHSGGSFSYNIPAHDTQQTKVFAGVNINLVAFDIGLDWDKTGDSNTYSLKFGFRF